MSLNIKSPKAVLLTAHRVAQEVLPPHRHACSPKKFTHHQIFACQALKAILKVDYRRVCGLLTDAPEFREAIGLRVTPHYSSLQKAAARMLQDADVSKLLDTTTAGGPASTPVAAVDPTGLTTDYASEYFTRMRRETGDEGPRTAYYAFPKLSLVRDVASHEILALRVGTGPSTDVSEFAGLIDQARARREFARMLADAGCDSESNHCLAREDLGVSTLIPAIRGRPSKDGKPPTVRYRREMAQEFDEA